VKHACRLAFGAECHIEAQRGSNEEARDYCKKDNRITEHGEFVPSYGQAGFRGRSAEQGPTRREKRKMIFDALKSKDKSVQDAIEEDPSDIQWILQVSHMIPTREEPALVMYLYGPTGTGKTVNVMRALSDKNISMYKKPPGHRWFDGYTGQEAIVFEEFSSCFPLSVFLSMCDPSPPTVEVKGGFASIQSKIYFILSNIPKENQYPNVENEHRRSAFYRRITMYLDTTQMTYGGIYLAVIDFIEQYCTLEPLGVIVQGESQL